MVDVTGDITRLSNRVKLIRLEKNLRRSDIYNKTGIRSNTISRAEECVDKTTVIILLEILDVMGYTLDIVPKENIDITTNQIGQLARYSSVINFFTYEIFPISNTLNANANIVIDILTKVICENYFDVLKSGGVLNSSQVLALICLEGENIADTIGLEDILDKLLNERAVIFSKYNISFNTMKHIVACLNTLKDNIKKNGER